MYMQVVKRKCQYRYTSTNDNHIHIRQDIYLSFINEHSREKNFFFLNFSFPLFFVLFFDWQKIRKGSIDISTIDEKVGALICDDERQRRRTKAIKRPQVRNRFLYTLSRGRSSSIRMTSRAQIDHLFKHFSLVFFNQNYFNKNKKSINFS